MQELRASHAAFDARDHVCAEAYGFSQPLLSHRITPAVSGDEMAETFSEIVNH